MLTADSQTETKNAALLKRIRERYRYGMDKWRRIREEGQKNIRYVSGDPWDEEDKVTRQGRPTVCSDELNQYVNQTVNQARMSPRGIKIDPAGDQATEELAEYRENRIRAIEYACNASQAYLNGLQGAVERNVGYWKVTRAYVDDQSDEQEILILPVMNADAVLIDPDYKELDGSDIRWAFELERIPLDVFEDEYPDATVQSFSADDFGEDGAYWYDGKTILVALYWEIKTSTKKVGKRGRTVQQRTITQYITNGFEILREGEPQPGPYIPIIPCFGKELWVDCGGGAERFLLSLVSLARDPQKALAYVMSSMMENVGQLPKTSFIGWKGMFETDSGAWATMNQVFHPFLQLDPVLGEGGQPLAPLGWAKSTPDFAAYSVGADLCRRAIMSAMGISPLPTAAQRQNQKSGVALQNIQSQQSVGSYHLIDAYDRAIKLTGRIINCWLSEVDLGETKRPVREADGTHKMVEINTDSAVTTEDGETYHFPIADDQGRYQVTVSTGVATESQRSEASDFADTLVQNLKGLPLAAPQAAQILALVIRLKQLGPLGDQMADIISPQQGGQQQQLAQMQQQGAQMQQQMAEMQATLQKLMLERQGKVIEMRGKAQQQAMQHVFDMTEADKDRETKLAIAEIETKAQIQSEREGMIGDLEAQFHQQAHDVALQNDQQAHEQQMQQAAAAQQSTLADQNAQNQMAQQQNQPASPAQGQ